jgi:hypothetical protein
MSGEVSYFSRFFVKFVEIIAAGLASAICAYLLAHFGGVLTSPFPASAPESAVIQAGGTASGVAGQPTPPVAAADAEHPVIQPDAPEAKVAPKAGKETKALPTRKQKIDTSAAEETRSEKSAEALVRDALANVDANRRAPVDAQIGSGLTDTSSVPVDNVSPMQAIATPQQPDVGPRPVEIPSRPVVEPAPYPDVPLQPIQSGPGPSADLPPRSPDVRTAPPNSSAASETAARQRLPAADHDNDVFSALTRIPLLRPDPPAANGEPPRPPMPVEKFGN